jgi:hypothetical protein
MKTACVLTLYGFLHRGSLKYPSFLGRCETTWVPAQAWRNRSGSPTVDTSYFRSNRIRNFEAKEEPSSFTM